MFRKCSGPVPGFTDTPDSVGKTENRPGAPGTPLITKITQTSTNPKKNPKISPISSVTGKRRLGQRLLVRLTNEDFKKAGPLENSKFSNCREIFP